MEFTNSLQMIPNTSYCTFLCAVSDRLPFQIKFGLSDDSESKCSNFVVSIYIHFMSSHF